ncbi:uronate dehydrogenase [Catenulispora sp. GAS73]|uniref:NAD-dependent epimerase/dehydratase family protein n=1 Tax=Catenulispora sp. GAS73 TaxID=3156269 RepID=UPI003519A8D7
MTSSVLVTGAAGRIGGYLRSGLPPLGWRVRCLDLAEPTEPEPDGLPWVIGDILDPEAVEEAMAGVETVVHLAGIPTEAPFADLLPANIDGTYRVFEAARLAGVRRVIYASSNHAVGFHESGSLLTASARACPDSLYGVTKAFGEALGSFYADRYGMDVAAVRIGSCFDRPPGERGLGTWLSPGDSVRLVDALLRAPSFGYAVLYGISANTRAWWDLGPARALGYRPEDDAEVFAEQILAENPALTHDDPDRRYVGGRMAVTSAHHRDLVPGAGRRAGGRVE